MLRTAGISAGVSRKITMGVTSAKPPAPPILTHCRFCSSKLKEQPEPEQAKVDRVTRDEEKLQRVIQNIKLKRMNLDKVIQDPKDDHSTPPPTSNPVHKAFISHSRTMARKKADEVAKLFRKKGSSVNNTRNELHELLETALPVKDQFDSEESISDMMEKSADQDSEWRDGYDQFQTRHTSGRTEEKEVSFADMIKSYEAINENKAKLEAERKQAESEKQSVENVESSKETADKSVSNQDNLEAEKLEIDQKVTEKDVKSSLDVKTVKDALSTKEPEIAEQVPTPSISKEDRQKFSELLKLTPSSFYDMSREHMKEETETEGSIKDLLKASTSIQEQEENLTLLLTQSTGQSGKSELESKRLKNQKLSDYLKPDSSVVEENVAEVQAEERKKPRGRKPRGERKDPNENIEMEDVFAKIKRKRAKTAAGSTESFIKIVKGKDLPEAQAQAQLEKDEGNAKLKELLRSSYSPWTGHQEMAQDPEVEESIQDLMSKMETATSSESSIDKEKAFQNDTLESRVEQEAKKRQPKMNWFSMHRIEGNTEASRSVLFGDKRLYAFSLRDLEPSEALMQSQEPQLSTWDMLYHLETHKVLAPKEENGFDEMVRLTKEGKLWEFPIDNEQGLQAESQVPFYDHIFLDRFCAEFPQHEKIQEFMQVVCLGLSKNPYMPLKKKLAHLQRLKAYFEDKMELLETSSNIEDEMNIFTD